MIVKELIEKLNRHEKIFIKETLIALTNGARIGTGHYTMGVDRKELNNLIQKL